MPKYKVNKFYQEVAEHPLATRTELFKVNSPLIYLFVNQIRFM